MSLARFFEKRQVATANRATVATVRIEKDKSVASAATVAVAKLKKPKAALFEKRQVATVPRWKREAHEEHDELPWLLDQAVTGLNLTRDRLLELLSDEDITDIQAGEIQLETVRAYAELWAEREPEINQQVTCGRCCHFQPDEIGDGSGIGSCSVGAWAPGGGMALYPNAKRFCNDFKRQEVPQ